MTRDNDIESPRTLHTFANPTSQPSNQNLQKSAILADPQPETCQRLVRYQPYRIDIVLDNDCNLDCKDCIRTKISEEKDIDHSRLIHRIIQNESSEKYQIHFTGGEPFLKWNSLTKIIKQTQNATNKEIDYSIYSNLILLNSEIIEFIKANKIQVHTSLDGLKDENDKVRGDGSYNEIVSSIERLNKNDVLLNSLTTTLKNENIQKISSDFIMTLEQLKIQTWRLNIDYYGINLKPESVIDRVFNLYVFANERGLSVEGTWLYPFLNLITDNRNGFCPATKGETTAILPDGKISMCPYSNSSLGTFHDNWNLISEQFNSRKQNLAKSQRCNECIIKDYCQTQCLITTEENNTNLLDWYCEIYRGLTVKLLNYHIDNVI